MISRFNQTKSSLGALLLFVVSLLSIMGFARYSRADRPAALSAQTIKAPSGPASLKGLGESFSPNMSTGTGNFSVPIQVAPGIVKPSVTLTYSGGKGKSALGMSFRLPVLNIYRTTDKGLPDFDEQDRFAVEGPSLNDELVLVNKDKRWYRLRNEGAFALFVRDPANDTWTIKMPSGETSYLGWSENERATSLGRSYRWYISRYEDRFNHEIRYEYFRDQGKVYLEQIRYQLEAPEEYQNTIYFQYESRPDVFTDYTYGAPVTCTQRMVAIEVYHGSRLLRRYALEYQNNMLFSLLKSVEMTGENGLKMPKLTFDYVQPSFDSGEFVSMSSLPPLEGLYDGAATLEDVNGDGLPDILYGLPGDYKYYENIDGYQWSKTPSFLRGDPGKGLYDEDTLLADIDGDGFRDVVHNHDGEFVYYPGGDIKDGVFRGYGAPVPLGSVPNPGYHFGSSQVKMTDLNFDGRVDLLYQKPGQDLKVINTEEDELEESFIPELPVDVDFSNPDLQLSDFNGDGILDFVLKEIFPQRARVRVWFGLGHGRYTREQSMANVPVGLGSEFYIQDVNRDSQADLVRVSGSWVTYYLNDGQMRYTGKRGDFSGLPSTGSTRKVLFADMNGNGTSDVVWLTVDYRLKYLDLFGEPNFGLLQRVSNGMGMVTTIEYRSSVEYLVDDKLTDEPWKLPMPSPVPVISEISTTDSLDAIGFEPNVSRTTFEYRDGYFDSKEREWRGFAQATSISHGDANHESLVTETWMHVGRNLTTGADEEILKGKPWLQLSKDLAGNLYSSVETNHEQRLMCQEDLVGVAEQILPYCDRISDREKHKEDLVAFAVQTGALSGSWEKTKNPRYTATASFFNEWGSQVRSENYGEVVFPGNRIPGQGFDLTKADITVGEDETVSETDFIYDVDKWLLNLPYESRAYDISGQILSRTRTYYDGNPFVGLGLGQVMQGLVMRSAVWLKEPGKPGRWIDTNRMKYNEDGLVIATRDANDNLVEMEYDLATHSLPVTERFHVDLGPLEFTAEYDEGLGAITAVTDLNGNTSRFYYDGLGRLTDIVDPMGRASQPTTHYDYQYGTPENPISTTTVRSLLDREKDLYQTSWQYSDGLGRGRLSKTEAEAEHGYIGSGWARLSPRGAATHVYDSFSSRYAGFEAPPSAAPVTMSELDGLGRAVKVYPPATEEYGLTYTKTIYKPFETWVYDERDSYEKTNRYPAVTQVDGLGRVRKIIKHNDVEGSFKKLEWIVDYNPLGSIVGFTDPRGNRRTYGYDNLQRMVHVSDPNVGTIDYRYDDVGNLVERIDALKQKQTFVYGKANRLLSAHMSRDANGARDYSYHYHYDTPADPLSDAQNLLGKLSWVEWPTGSHHVSYDRRDRLVEEVQTLWDGVSPYSNQKRDAFTQTYQYNAGGQLISQDIPGGMHLEFDYNDRSLLRGIKGGLAGKVGAIFSGIRYDHRGSMKRTDVRNGTSTCSWYDNRARLRGMLSGPTAEVSCEDDVAEPNAWAFQQLVYKRTPTGLIQEIQDLTPVMPDVPRFDASYKYDRLYQLSRAKTVDGTLSYTYDIIQNLTSRTTDPSPLFKDLPTGEFGYGERGAGPNQITSAGGKRFEYNAVGQMKRYNGFDLYFDVEIRLVKAKKPGRTTIEYYYDDTGEKKLTIIKKPGEENKVYRYVSGGYQIRNGKETWFVSGGHGQAEVTRAEGVRVDLAMLDEMTRYLDDPLNHKKPLPAEYMDLDNDGDFDTQDFEIAEEGYWTDTLVGQDAEVWRYYHKDHLGGSTVVTDSIGDVVSTMRYHPYGKISQRTGQKPVFGFAGGEIEEESELGLVRFGARWYAPDIGRWISADPLFSQSPKSTIKNPFQSGAYSYSDNSPINFIDPNGMTKKQAGSGNSSDVMVFTEEELYGSSSPGDVKVGETMVFTEEELYGSDTSGVTLELSIGTNVSSAMYTDSVNLKLQVDVLNGEIGYAVTQERTYTFGSVEAGVQGSLMGYYGNIDTVNNSTAGTFSAGTDAPGTDVGVGGAGSLMFDENGNVAGGGLGVNWSAGASADPLKWDIQAGNSSRVLSSGKTDIATAVTEHLPGIIKEAQTLTLQIMEDPSAAAESFYDVYKDIGPYVDVFGILE